MTNVRAFNLLCTLYFVLCSCPVSAQSRLELSGGPIWIGAIRFGSSEATLTGAGGDRFRLFSTSSELLRATGVEARVGYRVTRLVHAEISGSYARPQLSTTVGSDVESGPTLTASEAITQITIEGAGRVDLPVAAIGRHIMPFATAGAGYLRQLHEGATLVQTGRTYHVGGGATIALLSRDRGWLKQMGVRVDVRAQVRSGIALDGRAHAAPAVAAAIYGRFW